MAIDRKYGRVTTEHGDIGETEPVVVFRARDVNLPKLLTAYRGLCANGGSPAFHLEQIDAARDLVVSWQGNNPEQVRTPSSSGYAGRMGHRE